MTIRVLAPIVEAIQRCNDRYELFDASSSQAVAFSGGKDSFILLCALREAGTSAIPVVIDVGHAPGWGQDIASRASQLGFDPVVIDARDRQAQRRTTTNQVVRRRLQLLEIVTRGHAPGASPCTHCYSVKATLLHDFAMANGHPAVLFGQHQVDARASLLKEGLMRIAHETGAPSYSRSQFAELVENLRLESQAMEGDPGIVGPILSRLSELVQVTELDTDEPPRQALLAGDDRIELLRPMFHVEERDIQAAARALQLPVEGSGCGHGSSPDTYTPREMIHFGLLRSTAPSDALNEFVSGLVQHSLDGAGRGMARSRYRRTELLGASFKPTGGSGEDKL